MKSKYAIAPYSLWVALFIIIPLSLVVFFSFTNENIQFTFENIITVGKYSGIFLRSIWLGAISTAFCLVLGYPIAYFISKTNIRLQNILILLLMIPTWTSFLLRTYAWMTILENNGILNKLLKLANLPHVTIINTPYAVVLGMIYNFLPFMILPIQTVLTKMDRRIIEAAQDLGANRFKIFEKIILPLSVPGVVSGITMVFVPSVSTFILSKMLGGGSVLVIGDLIEMQFLGNSYNPHLGSAISLVLMVIIMLCTGIMNQFDGSNAHPEVR